MLHRSGCLLLALCATPGALHAQRASLRDLVRREHCDTSAFYDVERGLSTWADSMALVPLLRGFQTTPPDGYSVGIWVTAAGAIESVEVIANNHDEPARRALAERIEPLLRPPPATGRRYRVAISVAPDTATPIEVAPGEWTCLPALRDGAAVRRRFAGAIARLRRAEALPADAHGTVRLLYRVTPEGAATDVRVGQASGYAAADSAAVATLRGARHLPAVLGQHYAEMAATVGLSF